MMRRNLWSLFVVAIPAMALMLAGVAVAQDKKDDKKPEAGKTEPPKAEPKKDDKKGKDVVQTAMDAGNYKTLVDLLKAAELVDTLKGEGPFTVFAPTDEAFAKLPKGTIDDWKKTENKKKLQGVLTYHVAKAKLMAVDVQKAKTIKTINGQELTVTVKDKDVSVDHSKVTKTDVACSNGVIHTIDTVLMPKEKQ